MKRTALILLALILWPNLSLAAVKKINFEESPSSLGIGEIGKLIARFLDDGGQNAQVGETVNLDLQSSCSSGQFSASSTNWEPVNSLRVNSNWSSRTFYYKDSSAGTCDVTASVSGKDWTPAKTSITVGALSGGNAQDTSAADSDTGNDNEVVATEDKDKKTRKESTQPLSIDIGKKLTTTAGVPVILKAKVRGVKGDSGSKINWSFGDGGSLSLSSEAKHIYEYPGLYTAVATVESGTEQAESRVEIEVVEPKISIAGLLDGGKGITLENKTGEETRLDGASLSVANRSFIFPASTVLKKGAKITISHSISGLVVAPLDTVKLIAPSGKELATYRYELKDVVWRKLDRQELSRVQSELGGLVNELRQIQTEYAKIKNNN